MIFRGVVLWHFKSLENGIARLETISNIILFRSYSRILVLLTFSTYCKAVSAFYMLIIKIKKIYIFLSGTKSSKQDIDIWWPSFHKVIHGCPVANLILVVKHANDCIINIERIFTFLMWSLIVIGYFPQLVSVQHNYTKFW